MASGVKAAASSGGAENRTATTSDASVSDSAALTAPAWQGGIDTATPQRANKPLSAYDWDDFAIFQGHDITTEGNLVTVIAASREAALRDASNIVAIVPGEWTTKSSYEEVSDEQEPRWRVVLERKG